MTLIKEIDDIAIYVNSEGRFIAEIGDKVINKPSLRETEREIAKFARGIPVFEFDREYNLRQYTFIGCESDGSYGHVFRDKDNRRHKSYDTYYKSTPELIAELSDLESRVNAAMKDFDAQRRTILKNAQKISKDDFKTKKSE